MAASLAIHMRYEESLAAEWSREAGLDPETDMESRLPAAFLVAGNSSIARHLISCGRLRDYLPTARYVIDLACQKFPLPMTAKAAPAEVRDDYGFASQPARVPEPGARDGVD